MATGARADAPPRATDVATSCAAGAAALERGDHAAARAAFAAAVSACPDRAELHLLLANAERLAGDVLAARATLRAAVPHAQREPLAVRYELARALLATGEAETAVPLFARIAGERPRDVAVQAALASALRDAGRLAPALAAAERAVALDPRHAAARVTRAQVHHASGRFDDALADYDAALALRPGHAATHVQRAHTRLLLGDHAGGWADHERRPLPRPATGARDWHGEPLDGASILLLAEQGIGDQVQFLRFASQVAARGAGRVVVEAHASLVPWLVSQGLDAVPRGTVVATDWAVPLMSLPHRLQRHGRVGGEAVPYLRATPGEMPPLPPPDGRPRLGLVWSGNPEFPRNAERSLPAAIARAVASDAAVQWVSLQQGAAAAELAGVVPSVGALSDWAVTARVLAALDGLVTTCTGIAHVAGAMGIPTWILLPHVPDWRWGTDGAESAWYPSVRLVRQPAPGHWAPVVDQLRAMRPTCADRAARS